MLALTRTTTPFALALSIALGASGCGSGSGGSPGTATTDAARQKARVQFASCMRQHGVNVPDPGAGGPDRGVAFQKFDPNTPAFQSAFQTCRHFIASAFGNVTPQQRAQFRQQIVKFTSCLRSHGLNVPDPTFNDAPGGGPGGPGGPRVFRGGPFSKVDRNAPAFQAAQRACQSQLPQPPGGRGGGRFAFGIGSGRGPGG